MKIISPFQDYYDHAVHPSQMDEAIRFVRKTSIVPFDYEGSMNGVSIGKSIHHVTTQTFKDQKSRSDRYARTALLTVGAKAFQIIVPTYIPKDEVQFPPQRNGVPLRPWGSPSREVYERTLCEWIKDDKSTVEIEELHVRSGWDWYRRNDKSKPELTYIGPVEFNTTDLCMHYQTPVVLVARIDHEDARWTRDSLKVIVNPPLKAFNMMNVIDPWQTWQEISMWIGGVMPGGQSPMVEVSNTSKIIKAGFDPKISFRKRKET